MLLVRLRPEFWFRRTLLALAVGTFSSMVTAKQCAILDTVSTCTRDFSEIESGNVEGGNEIPVDGEHHTVDNEYNFNVYKVSAGGSLNVVNGSRIGAIISDRSTIRVDSSQVAGRVVVGRGGATISNSFIDSRDWLGLQLVTHLQDLSARAVAVVSNSQISGAGYGASVGPNGELTLSDSTLTGIGNLSGVFGNGGLRMTGGTAYVNNNTRVSGEIWGCM